MENGLRACFRSIRIGKILIRRDPDTKEARVMSPHCHMTCHVMHHVTSL